MSAAPRHLRWALTRGPSTRVSRRRAVAPEGGVDTGSPQSQQVPARSDCTEESRFAWPARDVSRSGSAQTLTSSAGCAWIDRNAHTRDWPLRALSSPLGSISGNNRCRRSPAGVPVTGNVCFRRAICRWMRMSELGMKLSQASRPAASYGSRSAIQAVPDAFMFPRSPDARILVGSENTRLRS